MSEDFSVSGVIAGVIIHGIYALILLGVKLGRKQLDRTNPVARKLAIGLIMVATVVGNLALLHFTGCWFPIFSSALLIVAFWILWNELGQFWNIGLIGADRTIRGGLDYARSLKMCKNSLSFLGIGARKLTEHAAEFERAIQQCNRPNKPIRLLLCKPDSAILTMAAQNAGRASDEYARRVQASLRVIAEYKERRQWNIQVKFYDVPRPLFRLMFIDDWLCLASHYVFGEGDGSQFPQLHVRRSATERDVNSLYHPFEQYFDELWSSSEPWDFQQYLEEI